MSTPDLNDLQFFAIDFLAEKMPPLIEANRLQCSEIGRTKQS